MGVDAEFASDNGPRPEGWEVLGADSARSSDAAARTSSRCSRSIGDHVRRVGPHGSTSRSTSRLRRRREEPLREIAHRVAVAREGERPGVTLEPMLAYERRIVHLAVQDSPGVKTESVGVDPNRRVVISSTAPGARRPSAVPARAPGGFRGPGGAADPADRVATVLAVASARDPWIPAWLETSATRSTLNSPLGAFRSHPLGWVASVRFLAWMSTGALARSSTSGSTRSARSPVASTSPFRHIHADRRAPPRRSPRPMSRS